MSLACITGGKICDGCMRCREGNDSELHCPVCGNELGPDDYIFIDEDDVILGCEYCVKKHYAEDVRDCYVA